jgi:hypothetical protein
MPSARWARRLMMRIELYRKRADTGTFESKGRQKKRFNNRENQSKQGLAFLFFTQKSDLPPI